MARPKLGDDPAGTSEQRNRLVDGMGYGQDRLAAFLGELAEFHPELPRVTSSRCPNDSSASRTARSLCRPTSPDISCGYEFSNPPSPTRSSKRCGLRLVSRAGFPMISIETRTLSMALRHHFR